MKPAALVVEDEPLVAEVVSDMLDALNFEVSRVLTSEAALRFMRARKFALVLSDIHLGGHLDGLAFAQKLRQEHPDLDVILMTGHLDRAHDASAEFVVLDKPFDFANLRDAVAGLRKKRSAAAAVGN